MEKSLERRAGTTKGSRMALSRVADASVSVAVGEKFQVAGSKRLHTGRAAARFRPAACEDDRFHPGWTLSVRRAPYLQSRTPERRARLAEFREPIKSLDLDVNLKTHSTQRRSDRAEGYGLRSAHIRRHISVSRATAAWGRWPIGRGQIPSARCCRCGTEAGRERTGTWRCSPPRRPGTRF